MLKMKTNDKGITLIALMVTVIVTIILAGVALNAAVGENGLIQQAKERKEEVKTEQTKTNDELRALLEERNTLVP